MPIRHAFVSGKPDGVDASVVRPSDWNAEHEGESAGVVPIGGIIMYHGLAENIPTGWALCDGQNGTPDWRDKFIIGAGGAYAVGEQGGSLSHHHANHSVTQPANHSDHSSNGGHTHDNHTISQGLIAAGVLSYVSNPVTHNNQGEHTHDAHSAHSGAAVDAHDTLETLPPFYATAFIMRIT